MPLKFADLHPEITRHTNLGDKLHTMLDTIRKAFGSVGSNADLQAVLADFDANKDEMVASFQNVRGPRLEGGKVPYIAPDANQPRAPGQPGTYDTRSGLDPRANAAQRQALDAGLTDIPAGAPRPDPYVAGTERTGADGTKFVTRQRANGTKYEAVDQRQPNGVV